jgi:hypothetical protein
MARVAKRFGSQQRINAADRTVRLKKNASGGER